MNADEISLRLTRQQADEFLQKLEGDDEFRGRLTRGGTTAREALAELGIEVPPELVPEQVVLPEPEHIRHFRRTPEPGESFRTDVDLCWIDIGFVLILLARALQRAS